MKAKKCILTGIVLIVAMVSLSAKEFVYSNDKATDVKLVLVEDGGNPYALSLTGKGAGRRGNPYHPELGVRDISDKAEVVDLVQADGIWKGEVDGPANGFLLVSYDGGETWRTRVGL